MFVVSVTLVILLSAAFPRVRASGSKLITIDGKPDDWLALGANARYVGFDPPYNIELGQVDSSDLLEGWACGDNESLYLMMRVRGSVFDWVKVSYDVWINVDPSQNSGALNRWDYAVFDVHYDTGDLLKWNETGSQWSYYAAVEASAGNLGYLEWKVPLSLIGNSTQFEFMFYTWDNDGYVTVNEIDSGVVTVPEFPSLFILLVSVATTLLAVTARMCCKMKRSSR